MGVSKIRISLITSLLLVVNLLVMGHSLFHEQMHSFIEQSLPVDSQQHCDCSCNNILDHSHDGERGSSCNLDREFVSTATVSPTSLLIDADIPILTIFYSSTQSTLTITKLSVKSLFYIDDSPLVGDISPLCLSLRAPPIFG